MKSCLYEGEVLHNRYSPKEHNFKYKLFLSYIDLDELDEVFSKSKFWSLEKLNFISFRRSTEKHLKSKLGYSAILALCTYAFVLSLSTFLVVAHTQSNYNQEVQLGKKMKSNAIICVSINSMQNKVLCSSKDVFNSTFKLGFIKLPMFLSVSFDQGDGVIVKEYK